MDRGEVWWARLPAPIGMRPVLLVSRKAAYAVRRSISIALITSKIRDIPVEVLLGPQDGMPRRCVVNCDEVHTVSTSVLDNRLTTLDDRKMEAVADAIRFALGVECD